MRQLSKKSDLFNPGQIHTAGGRWITEKEKEAKQKISSEEGGDVRRKG